jgi:hypothetical protein
MMISATILMLSNADNRDSAVIPGASAEPLDGIFTA